MEAPFRDPRFDLLAFVVGALGTAALSAGLAEALLQVSRANTGPDVGPTAATLGDAFSFIAGASLGVLLGCGLAAFFCRRGPRIATGILVGCLAWLTGFMPLAGWSDALFLGIPLALAGIIGAVIGAGLGAARDRRRRGHAREAPFA